MNGGTLTILYLVRHGATPSNLEQPEERYLGQREESLTDLGKRQAQVLAEMLKDVQLDAMFSSKHSRAIETAAYILRYHPLLALEPDTRLRELDMGIFDNLTPREARDQYRDSYLQREQDKFNFRIPSGDSYADLIYRVTPFVNEVLERYENGNVCIVGHQGVNRALLRCLLGDAIRNEQVPHFVIPHDAYIKVTKTPTAADAIVILTGGEQRSLEERL